MNQDQVVFNGGGYRLGLFILFLICGLSVFLINVAFSPLIPENIGFVLKMGLVVVFFALSMLACSSERFHRLWQVFFAFCIAAFALLATSYMGDWGLRIFDLNTTTPQGLAVAKLSESLVIVFCIILLTRISGSDMGSIFIAKGNLRLGLIIGLTSFIILSALSVLLAKAENIDPEIVLSFAPWALVFVLANGFMEELLYRGLFLKKLAPFFRNRLSNILTALIFTLAHIQVTYTQDLPVFLVITFLFALAWGYVMQKTNSLLASGLFHAGADTLIIVGIFANYGALP